MLDRAFEGLKLRNGLLLQGEETATSFVFCIHGGLWVEPWEGGSGW